MTAEERKEYNRKYYIDNKSRRSEYYAKRRDKTNEYSRKYYSQKKQKLVDLEKENAELKETLRTYNGCGDWDNDFHTCRVYLQHEELQEYIDQLTKAKKILEELANMEYVINPPADKVRSLMVKAEQFLKEIEK